jgi:hypothetical protein
MREVSATVRDGAAQFAIHRLSALRATVRPSTSTRRRTAGVVRWRGQPGFLGSIIHVRLHIAHCCHRALVVEPALRKVATSHAWRSGMWIISESGRNAAVTPVFSRMGICGVSLSTRNLQFRRLRSSHAPRAIRRTLRLRCPGYGPGTRHRSIAFHSHGLGRCPGVPPRRQLFPPRVLIYFACIGFAFVLFAALRWLARVAVLLRLATALPAILYHLVEAPMTT